MLSFIPHAIAGTVELVTPTEAVMLLGDAILGPDSRHEPLDPKSSRFQEIDALFEGFQHLLHDMAAAGQLHVLTQPLGVETLYRVPIDYWKGFGEMEGGFSESLYFWAGTSVDHRFDDAPVFYVKADICRLAENQEILSRVASPAGITFVPPPRPNDDAAEQGVLPPSAKASDRRDEGYAHEAARLVRAGKKLSDALRHVAPSDPTRKEESIQAAIRRTFDLMYDQKGRAILP